MRWHRVIFNYVDSLAGDGARAAIMDKVSAVYRKAGVPPGVEVFLKNKNGAYIYYFSPGAYELAHELLPNPEPCADEPDLTGFHKIPL
jgi:hypothetical protein